MHGGSGSGVPGHGRNPAPTPSMQQQVKSPSSSSVSPSSSSSTHVVLEQQQQQFRRQQQQQQFGFRQQQQFRKPEGEKIHLPYQSAGAHGVMAANNFPPSSSVHLKRSGNSPQQHSSSQNIEENQNEFQAPEQNMRNPLQQAYLQHAFHAAQQQKSFVNNQAQQQGKMTIVGPSSREQDIQTTNMKMQELMSLQAASQTQTARAKKSTEQLSYANKEVGHGSGDQRGEVKPPQTGDEQHFIPANVVRPAHAMQSQATLTDIPNRQFTMAQLKAIHDWALERGIDMSLPANANLFAQMFPAWQSRPPYVQKHEENNMTAQQAKQQAISQKAGIESSMQGNVVSNSSGHVAMKSTQSLQSGLISTTGTNYSLNAGNIQMQPQFTVQNNRENQNDRFPTRHPMSAGSGGPVVHPGQQSGALKNAAGHANLKNSGSEMHQMKHFREPLQLDRSVPQPDTTSSNDDVSNQISPHAEPAHMHQQRIGFTKQQLHVLKAQILAFRRIRNMLQSGQGAMPEELLQAIIPPPLDPQPHQQLRQDRNRVVNSEGRVGPSEINNGAPHVSFSKNDSVLKELPSHKDEAPKASHSHGISSLVVEHARIGSCEKVENSNSSVKPEVEVEHAIIQNSNKSDSDLTKGKTHPVQSTTTDLGPVKKSVPTSNVPAKDGGSTRKYHGPIFDFPFFMRKHDTFASETSGNNTNLILSYDVNDLLYEEGTEVLVKRREENIKKIGGLLAMNLERKRIRPDLVLRLQIEERKLRLLDRQACLRDEVDHQQQEIMAMPDRPYRKFVKQCERQRIEFLRQIQLSQKVVREKQLKSIFQWRKKLLEAHWAIRDARTTRNRGVAKYHERMLREFSKRKDDDRNKRMEALKNNDVDRYREMLLEQQTNISGDAAQRYSVLSSFLTQTEEYLHKLGGKITATKNHQEVKEAARVAAVAARSQGLSEEEVKAAAACAGEEVMIRNRFSEMNAPRDNSSINKYYNLAHAVNERVIKQPSMLRAGTLRDYQLVGLQWMLSLYNNKLNGILADEMGLGKTVQVMALIAYLMEYKGNYGPHLIIVPNAVLVNWKSELYNWLPSVSCIFYVGGKDQRSKLFSQEVCAMKFNILVTTYEFVMYDRSKLSKVDWKYIIIDEAQRMKDRESVLARDLDRYRCHRRLLLTGTPLQNDLKELWSLLNLLLPEVFDNRKAFHDWFSKPFQKDGPSHDSEEDDWLETEKKVIIIHRLHQILEPFMLRRRVEDVEGSLPRKVSIVLRCRMSAMQGAIYDWIKATGTIRVDPEDEKRRVQKNPSYQVKMYKNLNNKCMELRKACNHPLLNYPFFNDYSRDFLVRSCGKLWILDRILIKLQRTGHRVLLFSTMTKLLDILEEYLQWRHLVYRRIDGSTSLEDRESAIVDFNNPDGDCFIFLLSIRAAGRGLNLQTADTVVIYDPDPNPQNEEQAVARAHRIGQQREVKVIYMEAVVNKMSSYQKEDELYNGGIVDSEDDLAGKDRYIGSIESLIRSNIQQYKIDMADEVINAGRFDQRTTHEERRMTLETLLHDEERYQETVHDVPSLQEVNRMIARSDEEIELFDQMDEEFDWTGEMMKYYQVPKWLRAGSGEINALVASLSKKQSKNIFTGSSDLEVRDASAGRSPSKSEGRRMRPRGSDDKRYIYMELDDEDIEDSDASSEERITYSLQEEPEVGEYEDELNTVTGIPQSNKDQSEDDGLFGDGDAPELYQASDGRHNHLFEDADSGSSGSLRLHQPITPSTSQKFGSLSALDAKPDSISNRLMDELEEGEIAASGDSHVEFQHSQSSHHDLDDVEDEHLLQPKLKRKRSIRCRSRYMLEKPEETTRSDRTIPQCGSQLPLQIDQDFGPRGEASNMLVSNRLDANSLSLKSKSNLPSKKVKASSTPSSHTFSKSNRSNCFLGSAEDATEHSGGSWSSKASRNSGHNFVKAKLPDTMQRKCKSVISKFQRRVDNEGHQIVPIIFDFWRSSVVSSTKHLLDPRKLVQHVESFKYSGISDFVADVQLMLKNLVQHFSCSLEVISETRKLHELFFDILKVVFPDTDFRSARHAVSFSDPGGLVPVLSPKYSGSSLSKQHRRNNDVDSEPGSVKVSCRSHSTAKEDLRPQGYISKISKESKSNAASQGVPVRSPPFRSHPGDLVICKGKRKDREKTVALQGVGSASPSTPVTRGLVSPSSMGRGGPCSPVNPVRLVSASSAVSGRSARLPLEKDQNQGHQATHQGGWARQRPQQIDRISGISPVTEEAQWAKPVKRMRTDTGKRRPSHL